MTTRVLILLAITALAWLAVAGWERRPSWRTGTGSAAGLMLVTAEGCRLCGPAITALTQAGVAPTVVDVTTLADRAIRSVPTAIVTDHRGREVLRRSGRSVITDADRIARSVEKS
jgi:hypothetical protein